jgi:maltooligosyltrehalose trehalohydrolase
MQANEVAGPLGATLTDRGCRFVLWAPSATSVAVKLRDRTEMLEAEPRGYHVAEVAGVVAGDLYRFVLPGGREIPDPASRHQPHGVHGPSEVVALDFGEALHDPAWRGRSLRDWVIYELHVGTFTAEGTFGAAIADLDRLVELGVTVIELMPVAQCPGARNWGYDGVGLFAVQNNYGGPAGLAAFVAACHARGLAVVLDVVYNHLGPEGNVLGLLGPYFQSGYVTPWGPAINFDGPGSDEVRRFFIDNALSWLRDYHIDGLRLDAVHGIVDRSPYPFLAELSDRVRELGQASWPRLLVAESDANDPHLVWPRERGGLQLDGVWADDFHHAVHVACTAETRGYYVDYREPERLAAAIEHGFAYTGEYSPFRRRRHGAFPEGVPPEAFVVCVQNHDQIGNRMLGERLTQLADAPTCNLATALLLLNPHVPLLFQGQEYGETRPFLYFVDHGDPDLVEAVRRGRREEFSSFQWAGEPPDPQDPDTHRRSVLDRSVIDRAPHAGVWALHRELLAIRRCPWFESGRDHVGCRFVDGTHALLLELAPAADAEPHLCALFNLRPEPTRVAVTFGPGDWTRLLDADDPRWREGERERLGSDRMHMASAGPVSLELPPRWFGAWVRTPGAR